MLFVIDAFLKTQYDVKFVVRMYFGGMGNEARERAVADFNLGEANVFLGL